MSRVVAILLMLILPLQAFAAADRQLAHSAGAMLEHLMAHAEHVPHHHDDNGDIEHDDSQSSLSHLLEFDSSANFQGVVATPFLVPVLPHAQPAPGFRHGYVPDPTGSPPLRPPHLPA
ncbi:hypothetical protein K6V92_16020 [Cupriavidus respiraculi]|uniref:hypothetical protein n=1 Tax=Cupriavidus respiraculi TaxID=195930 RepID=UPI001C986283|nr:hypothetical protein [Cupriavidus respiraculi]MBY4948124.1 hypothetical protein [Cupriavidus respiraculi]